MRRDLGAHAPTFILPRDAGEERGGGESVSRIVADKEER